jgi:hypothetical protein
MFLKAMREYAKFQLTKEEIVSLMNFVTAAQCIAKLTHLAAAKVEGVIAKEVILVDDDEEDDNSILLRMLMMQMNQTS